MEKLDVLFLVAIAVMGILLIILLRQISILKKQADEIVREVKAYVAYVTEEPEAPVNQASQNQPEKEKNEEEQSRIIQAVLGEYFP